MDSKPSESWWSKDTVAVVTGANKGIGYEIVRLIAGKGPTVVLTARDPAKGQAAVDALTKQGLHSVVFHQLEVSNSESVEKLATWLQTEFGGVDILVNNAGVAPTAEMFYENAKSVFDTNYYGLKKVTEKMLPLLRASPAGPRVVNVSSRSGLYERLRGESLKQIFRDEEKYSMELLDSLATKYLEAVKAGRHDEEGWARAPHTYTESKMLVSCYTKVLARNLSNQIFVTAFCPGLTDTDMLAEDLATGLERPEGYDLKTPADGADTAVWLALLPKQELLERNGKFFGERKEIPLSTHPGF